MIFSSILFLFYFLPLFLLAYHCLPWRTGTLLIFSFLFYAYGEVFYCYVLLLSVGLNYLFGIGIADSSGTKRKWILGAGISINLALLFWFKYANFVYGALVQIGMPNLIPNLDIRLPLGISFFTFHAISYLIDVYRKVAPVERSLPLLAVYIGMFPQLIAGPIIRFHNIREELHERRTTLDMMAEGIRIFAVGLAMKVLIANLVATSADQIFALRPEGLTISLAWFGTLCYSLQIYFDFCGYSTMAIGLALMIGFHFPVNFNYPYISQSITEFWRRWHISLSSWFRDYLYIPLGGNRDGKLKTYRNLVIVFFLCGLWHGAAWTFIIWGLYHGLFLVIERAGFAKILERLPALVRHCYALLIIAVGWVFFRADTLPQALHHLATMFGLSAEATEIYQVAEFVDTQTLGGIVMGVIAATPLAKIAWRAVARQSHAGGQRRFAAIPNDLALYAVTLTLIFASVMRLAAGTYNPFIYFRF